MSNYQSSLEEPLTSWMAARLAASDEKALSEYMQAVGPDELESSRRLLRNLVEVQTTKIGNQLYVSRMFAIPVRMEADSAEGFPDLGNLDVKALMAAMQQARCLDKKEGVILLNAAAGRNFIEQKTPSELFHLARTMFMAATGGETNTGLQLTNEPLDMIALADGRLVMTCYLVGMQYWRHGKGELAPREYDSLAFKRWKRYAQEILRFASETGGRGSLTIEIGEIAPIFQAFSAAQMDLTDYVIEQGAGQFEEKGSAGVKATVTLQSATFAPTAYALAVELTDGRETMRYGVALREKLGDAVPLALDRIRATLERHGIPMEMRYGAIAARLH